MSILINDEKFEIFPYDTLDTIKDRYVTQKHTISKYAELKLLKEHNIKTEEKIINKVPIKFLSEVDYKVNYYEDSSFRCLTVIDIMKQIDVEESSDEGFSKSIDEIYTNITKETKIQISKIQIVFMYIIENFAIIEDNPPFEESYNEVREDSSLFGLNTYLDKYSTLTDYQSFFEDYKQAYFASESRLKTQNKNFKQASILKDYKLSKIKNSFMSEIKETQTKYDGEFELKVDIYELLNRFVPNRQMPFIKIAKFYKILNYFTTPIEWLEPEDENTESLRLYILKDYNESDNNISLPKAVNYVVIKIDQTTETEGIFKYKYNIISEGGQLVIDETLILTRFFDNINPIDIPQNMTLRETFGKGYLIFKGINLPREIIYDYALNDNIVSSIMTINESFKIEKVKGGIRFLLFNTISCSAVIKTITRPTEEEVDTFKGKVDVGDNIIRLDIKKAKSKVFLNHSIQTLQECLVYMNETKDDYFYDYYKTFIPNIKELIKKKTVIMDELTDLRDIFPEIYPSGYGRFCPNQPLAILDEKTANKEIEQGNDVMLFPLTATEGRQAWYVCKSSSHPYVGYKTNNLQNSETIGILPCCYENPHTTKGYLRYDYENNVVDLSGKKIEQEIDEEDEKSERILDNLIKTNKILKKDRYGVLPPNISALLNTVEINTLSGNTRFLRKGVNMSINSSIESLLLAKELEKDQISKIRKTILKLAPYNLASQNMLFPKDIIKIIDNNENVDPLTFLNILENIFQVNIILFCRNKTENKLGSFCTPYFKKYFIMNEKRDLFEQTVILFRTYGAEVDKVVYPQTELIVMEKNVSSGDKVKGSITTIFDTETPFIKKLFSLYFSTINVLNNNVNLQNKLTSQLEDSLGKIRTLNLKVNDKSLTVYSSPISSFDYSNFEKGKPDYTTKISINKYSTDLIKQFFESEKIKNVQKVLYSNFENKSILIGYYFIKEDLKGFVYVDNYENVNTITRNVFDSKLNEYVAPLGIGISLLDQYNSFIRLSNMLTSYLLYLFSKEYNQELDTLLKTNNNQEFNETLKKYVNEFEKRIIVQTDHEYKNKVRQLSLKNDSFIKNKKYLIASNEELKKRLLYALYSIIKNDIYTVINYKSKKYIPNFYTTAKDFEQSEHFTIYYTKKELALYNIDPTLNYKSFSLPPSVNENTFFLSNLDIMNGYTFLAQKVSNVGNAIYTSIYFNKYRINTTDRDSESSVNETNLTLFMYNGSNIFTEEIIISEGLDMTYILLLKQEGQVYYYVLLKY